MSFLIAVFFSYVIYGLVGALFPSVWPQIASDISVDYTLIGILMIISSIGSGLSSAYAYRIRRLLGTSRSIVVGLAFFALALLLFINATSVAMICIALAFLGIGSGIVDTIANSYIIKAYDSGKLSLLHANWGIGSTIGPIIMGLALTRTSSYKNGFLWAIILLIIMIIIILLLKVYWEAAKKNLDKEYVARHSVSEEEKNSKTNLLDIFKIKNGLTFVLCFIAFGAANSVINTWIATLAVGQRGLSVAEGATTASYYFVGITVTRLVLGVIATKIGNHRIIFGGAIISLIGYVMLFIRNDSVQYMYFVAIIIGIGISPLVPFLHSSVKEIFDEEYMGIVVSSCNSLSLAGSAIASALTTFVVRMIGINNVQILFIVFILIGAILFSKVIRSKEA